MSCCRQLLGVVSLADFAEVVAADATSLADAVMVTISAIAGAASLADAAILFPADPAGVVTVGVAPLADAGPVTMAVADLADAGILFPVDPAGTFSQVSQWGGGASSPSNARWRTLICFVRIRIPYKCPAFAGRDSLDTKPVTGSLHFAASGCHLADLIAEGLA